MYEFICLEIVQYKKIVRPQHKTLSWNFAHSNVGLYIFEDRQASHTTRTTRGQIDHIGELFNYIVSHSISQAQKMGRPHVVPSRRQIHESLDVHSTKHCLRHSIASSVHKDVWRLMVMLLLLLLVAKKTTTTSGWMDGRWRRTHQRQRTKAAAGRRSMCRRRENEDISRRKSNIKTSWTYKYKDIACIMYVCMIFVVLCV